MISVKGVFKERKKLTIIIAVILLLTVVTPALIYLLKPRGNYLVVAKDGSGDYKTIKEAIKFVDEGGTVFIKNGVYRESFEIDKRITLMGENSTNTVIEGKTEVDKTTISINNVDKVRFCQLNFSLSWYAIKAQNTDGIRIENNSFYGNFYGICLNNSIGGVVENNTVFSKQLFSFFLFEESMNNIIANNNFENRSGLKYELSDNNIISSNIFHSDIRAISLSQSDKNIIKGNSMLGCNIELRDSDLNLIDNNSIDAPTQYYVEGIHISSSDGNTVSNNIVYRFSQGVYLNLARNCIVVNNTLKYNPTSGVGLAYSEYNEVKDNTMEDSGIEISGDEKTHWSNNIIANNTVNGDEILFLKNISNNKLSQNPGQIIMFDCNNISISDINITKTNIAMGLYFSENITIHNSTFRSNNEAIVLEHSQYNYITNCTIFWNNVGIYLEYGSHYNHINYNNIACRTNTVYYTSSNNYSYNWWGVPNRPKDVNPYPDIYIPVLSAPNMPVTEKKTVVISDSNSPTRTPISDALELLNPGDTIFIKNGTYYEDGSIKVGMNVSIIGESKTGCIIKCYRFDIIADYILLEKLSIEEAEYSFDMGIYVDNAFNCKFRNITVTGFERCFYMQNSDYNTIENCTFKNSEDTSFELYSSNNNTINNCLFDNGDDVYINPIDTNIISNNLFFNTTIVGDVDYTKYSTDKFYNNTFTQG